MARDQFGTPKMKKQTAKMRDFLSTARTLNEALPYLQRYHGAIVVIKLGGHAMGSDEGMASFARDVMLMRTVGVNPVVVHGGGPMINEMLEKLGVTSTFTRGKRVTDAATMAVVEMVLSGQVNKRIVQAINAEGGRAVGLSGKDASMITCTMADPELGFVGEPSEVDTTLLRQLFEAEMIPVIAPIGADRDGHSYNINGILPIGIENIQSKDFGGFMLALIIGITGIVLSLPLGILLALGRQSDLFIINKFSVIFIEVIRGVPLIVWLFTASLLLNYFLPPGTNFDLMLRVIIMVTLFAAAYMAEVVRGGLAALPRGQYEGADSLGLDYWQSMRLIILPQALKISIPGIVNTFIGLFKDTTLVVFIGLLDPIGLSNAIRATTEWNGIYWELFIFIGLCFFVFCYAMSRYSQYLERKLATDRH
jgi:His/Glu/Gln/Arg/opine family amino acid ABC transporter permease subunit